MTLTGSTNTVYAIARGDNLISDALPTLDTAKQQLAHIEDTMRSIGLTPDVTLVEVTIKTTISKPRKLTDKTATADTTADITVSKHDTDDETVPRQVVGRISSR